MAVRVALDDPFAAPVPWRIHNVGSNDPVEITARVAMIEDALRPTPSVREGIGRFVEWYTAYELA